MEIESQPGNHYDIFAFDMDHCFMTYNMKTFPKVLYESMALFLINKLGYPFELIPQPKEESLLYRFSCRWVIDKEKLLILKVSDGLDILRAFDGYRRLPNEEILEIYGANPKISALDAKFQSKRYTKIAD